jgi:hypothetical protein
MGFVGSMVANSFFSALGGFGDHGAGQDEHAHSDHAPDEGDYAADDDGGFDDGGGFGDGGGDFEV